MRNGFACVLVVERLEEMQVILLERVGKLGTIGSVVEVKTGYARNFLFPQKKALRATDANLKHFKDRKAEIEVNNSKLKANAEKVAEKMSNILIVLVKQASDSGFLFGAVKAADIIEKLEEKGFSISKKQIQILAPIKSIGTHSVGIVLHPEVIVHISLRIMTAQEQTIVLEEPIQEA
ncbi:MAG: 50S ribosomal protein L9 [Holosporales bacterium]|jgi:large subunit ribosomal protein L9|nr:50S ribosomal protein L9 [Holosporales bacterium]